MRYISNPGYVLFLAIFVSGCGSSKQFRAPTAPSPDKHEKIFENSEYIVSQAPITTQNIEESFNTTPPHIAATAIKIENKKNTSCILEIERTNLGTYDSEELAIELSKQAINHPAIKDATIVYDCLQGATIGWTATVGAFTWYQLYKGMKRVGNSLSPTTERFAKGTIAFLGIVPLLIIGSLYYRYLSREKEAIREDIQENIIDIYKKVLDAAALSFDDMIEVPAHGSLEQVIFYNERPISREGDGTQKELVLKLTSNGKEILVPLQT